MHGGQVNGHVYEWAYIARSSCMTDGIAEKKIRGTGEAS